MDSHPFDSWTRDDARLLKTSLTKNHFSPVSVTQAYQRAVEAIDNNVGPDGQVAIPLFEADAPEPTREFVYYKRETNEVKFYDSEARQVNWLSPDEVATTELGQRLRWWIPNARQEVETLDEDQIPPETVTPITTLKDSETSAFFDEMRGLVRHERAADKERSREQYRELDLTQAIARGQLAGPLVPIGAVPYQNERVYKFQLVAKGDEDRDAKPNLRDDAEIFPDNKYIAGMREHSKNFPVEMESIYVGDNELWLRWINGTAKIGSSQDDALTDSESTLWLYDLANPLPYDRRIDAINDVQENRKKRNLLSGNRNTEFDPNKYAVSDSDIDLNTSQEKALIWAKAADDCLCIHGPPGTGKTRTLTAYIREAVSRDQRVLVTAHSNQAVDNLLVGNGSLEQPESNTLHALAQAEENEITIARAGSNSKNDVVRRYYQGVSSGNADIVAATTSGAAQFRRGSFNIGVIDEATQASRAATAIAFSVSQKLILAGDHKQLPPFTTADDELDGEQRPSLFETLMNRYGNEIAVMLQTQYRMNGTIAAFPNESFYNGKLETADRNRTWTIDDLSPLMGIHIDGTEKKRNESHSYYNPEEAEAAAKQVKLLTNTGLDPSDIGVIAAYRGQVDEIKQKVRLLDVPDLENVVINTVDAFQGSEREAIIVSFVRSNSDAASGFLTTADEGPRRLNVALTRGRRRLVVIGDWETLGECPSYHDSDGRCARLYADLATHISSINKMLNEEELSSS